jgi:ferric enterobactin receptor
MQCLIEHNTPRFVLTDSLGAVVSVLTLLYSAQLHAGEAEPSTTSNSAPSVIEEVDVIAKHTKPTATDINAATAKLLRVPGATLDPLAAIQSLPGVTFVSDTSSEPAVRGSAPEDNSYRIDTVPAKYVFHTFGSSIFNENTIQNFDLITGAFGSEFGNATGAIVDVSLRDPKNQSLSTTLDYSLLRAGAFFEGGITDNQAFYFSYRKSTLDLYYSPDSEEDEEGIKIDKVPVETDYQLKYLWDINLNHSISALFTGADDKVAATFSENSVAGAQDPDFQGAASINRGFDSQGLIWKYVSTNDEKHLTTSISHNKDQFDLRFGAAQFERTDNESTVLVSQFDSLITDSHKILLGGEYEQATLGYDVDAKIVPCSYFNPECDVTDAQRVLLSDEIDITFSRAYVQDHWQLTESLLLVTGVHFSDNDYLDEQFIEPRLKVSYALNDNYTFTGAIGQHHQFPEIEQIIEVIGNPELESPKAIHYVFGIKSFISEKWDWRAEVYYKDLEEQVMSLDEAIDPDFANNYSNDGEGEAYGAELLINRNAVDKWSGWLSVSYSKSRRINGRTDAEIPFEFDRPLMVNLVASYQWNELWSVSGKWRVQSGALYTPIVDLEQSERFPDVMNPVYGETYSERAPIYHRLDVRIERFKEYQSFDFTLFFDILNVYNQENVEEYIYAPNNRDLIDTPDGYASGIPVAQETGMEFFPSIGVKFTF